MSFRLHVTHGLVALAAALTSVAPAWAAAPTGPKIEVPGSVQVMSLTNGATIEIDGKVVGTVPLEEELVVMPGKHTVKVSKRGFSTYTEEFDVAPGGLVELEIDLLPSDGVVRITTTEPGATVKINGKVAGTTPFDMDVPAGKQVITISRADFYDEVREMEIRAGESYDMAITLRAMPTTGPDGGDEFYETWWFWTLVGVAAAGGAAAAVVGTQSGDTISPTPAFSLAVP